jgi:hypothetical protein
MIDATSVFDATTMVGTVTGDVIIGSGAGFEGRLLTVNVKGNLQGLVVGEENGGGAVVGNLTSTFTTTAGFGSSSSLATIGSGTGTNTAIVSTGECASQSEDEDQDDDNDNGHFAGPGNLPGLGTFGLSGHHHEGDQGGNSQD